MPRLLRPLMLVGFILIGIGVFSWLQMPQWRQSPMGAVVLLVTFGLGGYAVVTDLRAFWNEMRQGYLTQENSEQEHEDDNDL